MQLNADPQAAGMGGGEQGSSNREKIGKQPPDGDSQNGSVLKGLIAAIMPLLSGQQPQQSQGEDGLGPDSDGLAPIEAPDFSPINWSL